MKEECPNCGELKHQVVTCKNCGFTRSKIVPKKIDNKIQKKVKTKKKAKSPKINWGAIPVIKEDRARKKKLRKAIERAGGSYKSVTIRIVSGGGGPGTGKKR